MISLVKWLPICQQHCPQTGNQTNAELSNSCRMPMYYFTLFIECSNVSSVIIRASWSSFQTSTQFFISCPMLYIYSLFRMYINIQLQYKQVVWLYIVANNIILPFTSWLYIVANNIILPFTSCKILCFNFLNW